MLPRRGGGTVCKTTVVMNVNKGPCKQGDFLRQKSEALQLLIDTVASDSDWFNQYMDSICFDMGISVGSVDAELLFKSVIDCKNFERSGTYDSPRRLIDS